MYVPESKDDNNLDVSINGENDIPSGSTVILEDNKSVTHENVPFLPVSNENSKIDVIHQIIIPNPIDQAAFEGQFNQEEHIMEPLNNLLLVTKKGKPRKRRTLSTPLAARKKAKKDEKRKEYYVKPPCSVNCRRQCISHIAENRRIQINDEFWQMSWDEQRQFILNNTQRLNVKRQTNRVDVSARKSTFAYHMKNESGTIFQVCKPFFLTTLGFKPSNDKVVQNTLNMSVNHLTFTRDRRGLYIISRFKTICLISITFQVKSLLPKNWTELRYGSILNHFTPQSHITVGNKLRIDGIYLVI